MAQSDTAVSAGEVLDIELASPSGDEPLVELVYKTLRDAICTGQLPANRKLAQIPLAKQLGISRTPVRDALQRLAQEGLVRAVSYRGFAVSEFSAHEVLEIYDLRLALEPWAAREAVGRHSRLDLARLADNCDATAAAVGGSIEEMYELNEAFHRGLVEPCPNRLLVRMLAQLWQLPSSLRMFHTQAAKEIDPVQFGYEEHRGILDALEARDADLLVARLTQHITDARRATLAVADSAEPGEADRDHPPVGGVRSGGSGRPSHSA